MHKILIRIINIVNICHSVIKIIFVTILNQRILGVIPLLDFYENYSCSYVTLCGLMV
jgi:hypothetical protein